MRDDTTNASSDPTDPPARSHPDVQIVGGGLAGLLAANLAVDHGLTVRLIERSTRPGGRAASTDHHGYTLNVGPHALYLQGELRHTLIQLGLDPAGAPPDTAGGTGSIGDRIGLLPIGPTSLARTRLLGAGAKLELGRLLARLPRLDPAEGADLTVTEWLASQTNRPELRTFLQGIVNLTTYTAAGDRTSADATIAQLQMALDQSVRYIDGGWGTIVGWLSDRADRLGVERVAAAVTAVETGGEPTAEPPPAAGPVVVTADGRRLGARTCVLAVGAPGVADRLLGLGRRLADQAGPPVEAAVLDLGLRRRPPVGTHLGLDTRLYATVHSEAADLTPADRHLVVAARYHRPDEDPDPDVTRRLLHDHAATMGVDGDAIEMERYLHRLMVAGGMPLAERGGLAGRPDGAVIDRPGVHLAGDWVGPNGLLADASAASAVAAVDAVRAGLAADHRPGRNGSPAPVGRARLVGS